MEGSSDLMVNILLIGCLGRIGREISKYVLKLDRYQIIAGIDKNQSKNLSPGYDIYDNFKEIIEKNIKADVAIDFSNPNLVNQTLEFCKETATPLVLGTTGICKEDETNIKEASKTIPIFWTPNVSIGINLLVAACKNIIKASDDIFDIDIIEKHHNKKVDSPSGTANMIANIIKRLSEEKYITKKTITTNNFDFNKIRNKDEIRIYSLRSGNMTGEHSVIFSYGDETLTISHSAMSKEIFAKGAIQAANFIINQKPNLYNLL